MESEYIKELKKELVELNLKITELTHDLHEYQTKAENLERKIKEYKFLYE